MSIDPDYCADGRNPDLVPENWSEFLDPQEWRIGERGLPFRKAARALVLRKYPEPAVLLVVGHDFGDELHRWIFTPGGGILSSESALEAAQRELQEETGLALPINAFVGPVLRRTALFEFKTMTCIQAEEFFLARLDDDAAAGTGAAGQEMERVGWTSLEQDLLDSVRWWTLTELDQTVAAGHLIFPAELPQLIRELLNGWDGQVRELFE